MSAHEPKTPQEKIRDIGICLFCLFIVVPLVSFIIIYATMSMTIPADTGPSFTPPTPEQATQIAMSTAAPASGHTIYMAQCASCHGDSGDGNGTRELDRPARSFKAGGFSFGDTEEAITRVVRSGIAGTPMPGFARTLSPDEIKAVVEHVRTLGPERVEVNLADSVMAVTDRPVVVRGKLPEQHMGMGEIPRGIVAGNPDGLSFVYRGDDVRLLGTRQGAFVRRTDWDGRGGTALDLQGRLIHLVPDVPVFERDGSPLAAELAATDTGGDRASLHYSVGPVRIREQAGAVTQGPLAGYARRLEVDGGGGIHMRLPAWRDGGLERIGPAGAWTWWQEPAFDGRMHFVGVRGAQPLDEGVLVLPDRGTVEIRVFPDSPISEAAQAGIPVKQAVAS